MKDYLRLRTFIVLGVIAVFAYAMHPLAPQDFYKVFRTVLKDDMSKLQGEKLIADAHALEEAGCFAIVLEKIPAELAKRVTEVVSCPTIGIGAGNVTDGQVLVLHDMLGLNEGFKPKFLRQFAHLGEAVKTAVGEYVTAVKDCSFPSQEESY